MYRRLDGPQMLSGRLGDVEKGKLLTSISIELDPSAVEPVACRRALLQALKLLKTKQTPWPLVRERIIPTERPPLIDEI
jgi:hypothetical protein